MADSAKPLVVCIVGATSTGKSELALAVAGEAGGEIVSADSMQVYRGLDIGTAKVGEKQRREIPHYLIDCCDPRDIFSAGSFQAMAERAITDIHNRGRLPIVVGGTGLYLRALLLGLAQVGPGDRAVRERLRRRAVLRGLPAMFRLLERLDPAAARKLKPGDSQRVLRALEYRVSTGRRFSEAIDGDPFTGERYRTLKFGLKLPRGRLRRRIDLRVDEMIQAGWIGEVEGLLRSGVPRDCHAFKAIGYRQIVRCIGKEVRLDEAIKEIKKRTHQYAKRQETWFRRERDILWIDADSTAAAKKIIIEAIKGQKNER